MKAIQLIIATVMVAMIFSCNASRKADKQLSQIVNKYPEKIAAIARVKYPCIITPIDSTIHTDTVFFKKDTDTLRIDSTVYVKCPNGDSVKARLERWFITNHISIERTIRITATIKDSADVFLVNKQLADKNALILKQNRRHTRDSTLFWAAVVVLVISVAGNVLLLSIRSKSIIP